MGYQSKTYSLSDEVVAVIEGEKAKGVTPNRLLMAALKVGDIDGEAHRAVAQLEVDDHVKKIDEQMRRPEGKFPCRCVHSGCKGASFKGFTKYANLCSECRESGHRSNPAECPECNAGGAL